MMLSNRLQKSQKVVYAVFAAENST